MRVDTKTMLDENRERLGGIDCSVVWSPNRRGTIGYVGLVMAARYNGEVDSSTLHLPSIDLNRPKVNYFESFPDRALLEPEHKDHEQVLETEIDAMIQRAYDAGFEPALQGELKDLVLFQDVFLIGLSDGPPATLKPLVMELPANAKIVKVKLRKYSQKQMTFLSKFVSELITKGML